MAVTLRHIKTLRNNNITIDQALFAFIFGNNIPKPYVETSIYNRGDIIVTFDTTTNRNKILQCIVDGTTGTFNSANWTSNIVADIITGKSVNRALIQVATAQPTDASNMIWYKQVKVKTSIDPTNII